MKQLDEINFRQININNSVFVEIYDKGFDHMDQTYKDLYHAERFGNEIVLPSEILKKYRTVKLGDVVMYELQLWEFMEFFGNIMHMGTTNEYFNFNIYIEK